MYHSLGNHNYKVCIQSLQGRYCMSLEDMLGMFLQHSLLQDHKVDILIHLAEILILDHKGSMNMTQGMTYMYLEGMIDNHLHLRTVHSDITHILLNWQRLVDHIRTINNSRNLGVKYIDLLGTLDTLLHLENNHPLHISRILFHLLLEDQDHRVNNYMRQL